MLKFIKLNKYLIMFIIFFLLTSPLYADSYFSDSYIKIGVGNSKLQNYDLEIFFSKPLEPNPFEELQSKNGINNYGLMFSFGKQLSEVFSLELSYIRSTFKEDQVNNEINAGIGSFNFQIPFSKVKPYFGFGIGIANLNSKGYIKYQGNDRFFQLGDSNMLYMAKMGIDIEIIDGLLLFTEYNTYIINNITASHWTDHLATDYIGIKTDINVHNIFLGIKKMF